MTISELEDFRMPFGKYRGDRLRAIALSDREYLEWLISDTNPGLELKDAIKFHLARR